MKSLFSTIIFLAQLLTPAAPENLQVEAALRNVSPECLTGDDPTCFTGLDENGNGRVDSTPPAASLVAVTGGYSANFKDCSIIAPFVSEADTVSISGTVVTKPTGTPDEQGEIGCANSAITPGTYYAWIRVINAVGPMPVYLKVSSTNGLNFDTANLTTINQTNPPSWIEITTNGEPRQFVNPTRFYLKSPGLPRFDCLFISTSAAAAPICQSETGATQPDYVFLELNTPTESTPTDWNSAAFAHANIMQWNGSEDAVSPQICGGVLTVKALWDKDTSPPRQYWSIVCNDTDDETVTSSNDDTSLASTSQDRFRFDWRKDLAQANNNETYGFVANLFPVYSDWNYTGAGVRDYTTNVTTTVVKTVVAGANWKMFIAADLPGMTVDTTGACQATILEKDTSTSTAIKYLHGSSVTDLLQWGRCKWSSTAVAASGGGGDLTAPAVTSLAITTTTSNGITATANTNEAGNCKLYVGVTTGVYTSQSPGSNSANGKCAETITTLSPGTNYFVVMKVTDAAGNIGTSTTELTFTTTSSTNATRFVSNSGTGNCLSISTPCLPSQVWATVQPGAIIEFANGVYTCASCMLHPPEFMNGTQPQRITVRAQTEGGVRIDGGGTKLPIELKNNDWFIIEGLNAHNGSCSVVQIGSGADNNIVRKVVAWDALASGNCIVFQSSKNTGNLFEDVAGFGTGRKIFENYGTPLDQDATDLSANFTLRRAWARFQANTHTSGKTAYSTTYKAHNERLENVLATWDDAGVAQVTGDANYLIGNDHWNPGLLGCAPYSLLYSIVYTMARDTLTSSGVNWLSFLNSGQYEACAEIRNVVVYAANDPVVKPVNLVNNCSTCAQTHAFAIVPKVYANGTEITGAAPASRIDSGWTVTNRVTQATLGSINIWNGAGTSGARICYRSINGVLQDGTGGTTVQKLWPWPMNQRIIDALKTAGRPTADVTADMETLFGTIPAACK